MVIGVILQCVFLHASSSAAAPTRNIAVKQKNLPTWGRIAAVCEKINTSRNTFSVGREPVRVQKTLLCNKLTPKSIYASDELQRRRWRGRSRSRSGGRSKEAGEEGHEESVDGQGNGGQASRPPGRGGRSEEAFGQGAKTGGGGKQKADLLVSSLFVLFSMVSRSC